MLRVRWRSVFVYNDLKRSRVCIYQRTKVEFELIDNESTLEATVILRNSMVRQ